MNRFTVLTLIAFGMLASCGKEAPRTTQDVPTQTASEARQVDERAIAERLEQQKTAADDKGLRDRLQAERTIKVDALRSIGRRWNDALAEATRTGRSEIGGPIEKIQGLKREAEAVVVDDCTGAARDTLLASISGALDAYNLFRQQTGDVSDSVKSKLTEAVAQLSESDKQLSACTTITN